MDHHPDQPIETARHAARRMLAVLERAAALITLCLIAACTGPRHGPTAQEISAAVGRTDAGVTAGPTGGAPVGSGAYLGLDDQERHRLLDAVRVAFVATTSATTAYTVVPQNIDAEPTAVAATPAGPRGTRADGSVCRAIQLSVTKQEQTTTGTVTFCQAPGSADLKPAH
jgi:hypothetical protein